MNHVALASLPEPVRRLDERVMAPSHHFSFAHAELFSPEVVTSLRSSASVAIADDELARISQMFAAANERFFRFELFSPLEIEVLGVAQVQYRDLLPGPDLAAPTRKLAIAVPLELPISRDAVTARFLQVDKQVEFAVGRAIAYPAFAPVVLRLEPEEQADLLIAVAHGPTFR